MLSQIYRENQIFDTSPWQRRQKLDRAEPQARGSVVPNQGLSIETCSNYQAIFFQEC